MIFIGIDPGKNGSIAILKEGGKLLELVSIPLINVKKKDYDIFMINDYLKSFTYKNNIFCILEKAQAMPGQGATSMFSIGKGYGILLGILTSLSIPFQVVHPRVWSNKLLKGVGGVGKDRNYSAAQRLFPSWKPNYKYEKEWADSLLLAEYGRRIYGKTD